MTDNNPDSIIDRLHFLEKENEMMRTRLEAFKNEMLDWQREFPEICSNFLRIGAYKEASECAMRAEAIKFAIGRIPLFDPPNV